MPGRWACRSLSVNYRTPAEIMTVAGALLAEFAPGIQPPESVRACGVKPWSRRVTEDELTALNGPGDTTPQPCPPELLARRRAEREKWLRWRHVIEQPPSAAGPTAPTDAGQAPPTDG